MKHRFYSFLAGAVTTALVGTLAVSAFAISGRMTIEVDPIDVQVNGEVFQPTDANGNEVPVFAYNGTTYAPLRALAEAYGLEVGYDPATNMATVVDPDASDTRSEDIGAASGDDYSAWSDEQDAAYLEFKSVWRITTQDADYGSFINLHCSEDDEPSMDMFLRSHTVEEIEQFCARFDMELYTAYQRPNIMYHFMARGTWGWADVFLDGWTYGYRSYLQNSPPI